MDLTEPVIYRSFYLNSADIAVTTAGISGCVIDSVDFSDVDVVQFIEKRSQHDGMDADDVYLGARRIRMAGTLYALTRPLLFDAYWELRAALNPVLAQREEPLDLGYRPLYFTVPTNRLDDYPEGTIALRMLALPRAFQAMFIRDQSGGEITDPLAIPWQATFICKDPSIMGASPQDYDVYANPSGNLVNRGTYLCPINMLLVVGAAAGSIAGTMGDSVFTITIPASTGNRTIRFKGEDGLLTVEEDSVEVTRQDLITFSNDTTWPQVATGTSGYSLTPTGVTIADGSHLWFYERYA